MNLSRRTFLRGSLAVVAAATVVKIPFIPEIWGDGIFDDTEGLQALFNNNPVNIMTDSVALMNSDWFELRNGIFKVTRKLTIKRSYSSILNCTFLAEHRDTILEMKNCRNNIISDVHLRQVLEPKLPVPIWTKL